jgi:hypothetical protein
MKAKAIAATLGGRKSGRSHSPTKPLALPRAWLTATDVIHAELAPLDRVGNYRINAVGFSLKNRYPENRMAKVLFDAGYRGRLEVYGPSADDRNVHRFTCDIEKMAERQMTETSLGGIGFVPWTEKSLAALEASTRPIPSSQEAENNVCRPRLPTSVENRPSREGIDREAHTGAGATRNDPPREETAM